MVGRTIKYSKLSPADGNLSLDDGLDESTTQSSFKSIFVSVVLVAAMILTWVLMSEWLQDNAYIKSHELFMRYLVVAAYTFAAIPAFVLERCFEHRGRTPLAGKSFFRRTALWTICLSWITMWVAGYIWYLSLRETSAALNNSLYQSQCMFTYLFSVLLLGESITLRKTVACMISFLGVFAISFGGGTSKEASQKNTVQGSIVCVISAVLFSILQVSAKVIEEKHYEKKFLLRDSMYFLGYCGFWVLVLGPFLLFGCHKFEFEHFDLPSDLESILTVVEIVVLDLVFNMALIIAIAFSTPFFVALGLLAVIPTTFLSDYLSGKMTTRPGGMQITGTLLVVIGFLVLKLPLSGLCYPTRSMQPTNAESATAVLSMTSVPNLEVIQEGDDKNSTIKSREVETPGKRKS